MEYDFELTHYYQFFDNFKEKKIGILMKVLSGDPILYESIRFKSYGHISFKDDDKHKANPHIEEIERVGRGKCNCLIYDLLPNEWNNNFYDKLFIYKGDVRKHETYGYIMYNTKTGDVMQKWSIDQMDDILAQHIKRSIFSMTWKNFSPLYLRKYTKNAPREYEIKNLEEKFGVPHFS